MSLIFAIFLPLPVILMWFFAKIEFSLVGLCCCS